jgi:hypothetical protein
MTENNQRVKDLYDQNFQTYLKKNEKYGDSFHRTFERVGPISALTRITDKYERYFQMTMNPTDDDNGESIIDTLLDMANYAIMTVAEVKRVEETAHEPA